MRWKSVYAGSVISPNGAAEPGPRGIAPILGAQRLDRRERRAADPADVDGLDPKRAQTPRDGPANTCTGLLRDDRHHAVPHESADRRVETGRAGLPLGLHG